MTFSFEHNLETCAGMALTAQFGIFTLAKATLIVIVYVETAFSMSNLKGNEDRITLNTGEQLIMALVEALVEPRVSIRLCLLWMVSAQVGCQKCQHSSRGHDTARATEAVLRSL